MTNNVDYIPGNKAWITQRFHPVFDGTQTVAVPPLILTSEAGPILISETSVSQTSLALIAAGAPGAFGPPGGGLILISQTGQTQPIGVLVRFC